MPDDKPRLAFAREGRKVKRSVYSTVRLGGKWAKKWIENGERSFDVLLLGPSGEIIGEATIVNVRYGALGTISDGAMALDYNAPGMTPADHADVLSEIYNRSVNVISHVTEVFFVIK